MRWPRWRSRAARPAREAPLRVEAPLSEAEAPPEELLVFGLEGLEFDDRAPWRARERMAEEASDLLDRRLDLTRDAAPWNVATFATLAACSAAGGATVALTGPAAWWLALTPWSLAVAFLCLTALSVRQLRPRPPRPARRAPRTLPDPREIPLDSPAPGDTPGSAAPGDASGSAAPPPDGPPGPP